MNTENSKTNEPHKFVLKDQTQRLVKKIRLKKFKQTYCSSKLIYYYMWKNKEKQYKNNKLKIIVPARNDEFELLDGFVSATQDYIEYIIKKHET